MLQRSKLKSPGALRSAERRARHHAGIEHVLNVRRNTRRLTAMLRAYAQARHPFPEGDLTRQELETELDAFLEEVELHWLGPRKK